MKKLLFLSILFLVGIMANAQRVYFIYLQSDNAIPFYVKMGDKIHSSSAAGYLILSNLKDSTYSFSVGLLGKQQVEPKFKVDISNGDRGFLIKQLDQKLNLFDLHSLEILAPLAAAEIKKEDYITRTDNFTRTLSQAANDPSLLMEVVRREPVKEIAKSKAEPKSEVAIVKEEKVEKPVVVDSAAVVSATPVVDSTLKDTIAIDVAKAPDTAPKDTIAIVASTNAVDTAAMAQTATTKMEENKEEKTIEEKVEQKVEPVKVESVVATPEVAENKEVDVEYKKSKVVRRSESSTSEGFGLTFIDYESEGSDTIRLLIPNPKTPYKAPIETQTQVKEEVKQLEILTEAPNQIDTSTVTTTPKNECNATATESDFRKLRKDMAAQEADEDMISKAQKAFKNKCFTTEQVKNLSTLFLSTAGKYQFFDAAYTHVSDLENFATLGTELKEEYYINRFKALIGK